jgi:hypothetical protein
MALENDIGKWHLKTVFENTVGNILRKMCLKIGVLK